MASPVSPIPQSIQHDKKYYIQGGDLVVLVENILFRVHRYFFERESAFFKSILEEPPKENEPGRGTSDSTAIMLDTTASQFSRFVWVFYNPKYSLYDDASLEDWKSILELSHRWLFPEVKQLAIRELQKQTLSPVQRIELYHKNAVDRKHLIGDYIELCQRPQPLNLREGLDLGLETTLMIAQAREEIRSPRSPQGVMTPLTPTLQGPELTGLIGKMFVFPEGDSNGSATTEATGQQQQQQSNTRPVIKINGAPEPKVSSAESKTPKGEGANGQTSGGPANNKTDKQNHSKNQSRNSKKGKNQAQGESKEQKTTSSQTAETKKATSPERNKNNEVPTPVPGEQGGAGAVTGGTEGDSKPGANGNNNQENENESSNSNLKGDVGTQGEPEKDEGSVDAQGANAGGTTGDSIEPNGQTGDVNGDADKNKTGTQLSPTTGQSGGDQQGTQANGVENGDA